MVTEKEIWQYIEEVFDPEVPVLTIVDLGVVRDIKLEKERCLVTITPTYSGCPAMTRISDDIIEKLNEKEIKNVEVDLVLAPAWTTDWINEKGRKALEDYGIASPLEESLDKRALLDGEKIVKCPQCKSTNTQMISQFGSTACKALFKCDDCHEAFDYFKCLK